MRRLVSTSLRGTSSGSFSEDEHETRGYAGRFGLGSPRINDGLLLFLLLPGRIEVVQPSLGAPWAMARAKGKSSSHPLYAHPLDPAS